MENKMRQEELSAQRTRMGITAACFLAGGIALWFICKKIVESDRLSMAPRPNLDSLASLCALSGAFCFLLFLLFGVVFLESFCIIPTDHDDDGGEW